MITTTIQVYAHCPNCGQPTWGQHHLFCTAICTRIKWHRRKNEA